MVFAIIVAIVVALVAVKCVLVVPESHVVIVERLGRYQATLGPGLHAIAPFIDVVRCRYSLEEQTVEIATNEPCKLKATIRYRILDPRVAHYNVDDFQDALRNLIVTALRHQVGARTRPEVREDRRAVCEGVVQETDALAGQFGLKVLGCEIEIE